MMTDNQSTKPRQKEQAPDLQELVCALYQAYTSQTGDNLWPWEKARWYELVFCILNTVVEPSVSVSTTRRLTNMLSEMKLLEIEDLAGLNFIEDGEKETNPLFVTMDTLLKKSGFSPEKSKSALAAICRAAQGMEHKFGGKVQNYFHQYGTYILDQAENDFGFSKDTTEYRALTIWLQNTLNMPVPASNPIADLACEQLGVNYSDLVEAANKQDINIALLDDALRVYWKNTLRKE